MITNSPRTTVETGFFPCCAVLVVVSLAPVPSNFWIQVYRWEKRGKVLDEGMSRTDYSLKIVRWWDAIGRSVQLVSADITADTELCTSLGGCHRHHSEPQHRSGYGLHDLSIVPAWQVFLGLDTWDSLDSPCPHLWLFFHASTLHSSY